MIKHLIDQRCHVIITLHYLFGDCEDQENVLLAFTRFEHIVLGPSYPPGSWWLLV